VLRKARVQIVRVKDERQKETHGSKKHEYDDERAVDTRVSVPVIRIHAAFDEGDESQETTRDKQTSAVVPHRQK